MARSRIKAKGRASGGSFLALPHNALEHENFVRLSARAVKLLIDMGLQYRGTNNGTLAATWNTMARRNWKSRETLELAIDELLHFGWIKETRKGGIRIARLYALTFQPVNDTKTRLDVMSSAVASNEWKAAREPWTDPQWYNARKMRRKKKRDKRDEGNSLNTDTTAFNTDAVSMGRLANDP